MRRVFFSIIIPTLNEEKYLPKLLSSLLKQREGSFEIFVVDGQSKDRTVKVASNFAQKFKEKGRPLKIISSPKRNVSFQRNLGAKKAKGEWLVFFDADVWFDKNYLRQIKKEIKKNKACFLTTWNKNDGKTRGEKALAMLGNGTFEASLVVGKPLVPGYCFFVKREIFQKSGGFNERILVGEDLDLANRIYEKGYKLLILKRPKIGVSLRRYRKDGVIGVLGKYTKVGLHLLLEGNHALEKKLVDYPMGGEYYLRYKKKSFWERLRGKMLSWLMPNG